MGAERIIEELKIQEVRNSMEIWLFVIV